MKKKQTHARIFRTDKSELKRIKKRFNLRSEAQAIRFLLRKKKK